MMATRTTTPTMPRPTIPRRENRRRAASLPSRTGSVSATCVDISEPGPQAGGGQDADDVGGQVTHDVDGRDEQGERLDRRGVTGLDGIDQGLADAGVGEQFLDDDDAPGQP